MEGKQLLDQIARYLEEAGIPFTEGSEWCQDGSDALIVTKLTDWKTIIQICCWTPPNRPPMVTFWVPVLEAVGYRSRRKKTLTTAEEEAIQNDAINQADLLNGDPLIGRWNYKHEMNRIDLTYEMLAVDLTKSQLIGVVELLMKDAEAGSSLQEELGGTDWVEQTGMVLDVFKERLGQERDEESGQP